jgi:hypothetical protein
MKRSTVIVDRVSCAIVGSGLIALGVAAAAWERGALPRPRGAAVRLPRIATDTESAWWPVILGVVAVVLVFAGLRWLVSHRPGQTLSSTTLPGSDAAGRLSVDVNAVAEAAAVDLARHPQIDAAKGTTRVDRGQRLIELTVKIALTGDSLGGAATAVNSLRHDLAEVLAGVPHTSRVLLRTASARRSRARVR